MKAKKAQISIDSMITVEARDVVLRDQLFGINNTPEKIEPSLTDIIKQYIKTDKQ